MKKYALNIELPILNALQMAEQITGLTTHEQCMTISRAHGQWRDLIQDAQQLRNNTLSDKLRTLESSIPQIAMLTSEQPLNRRILALTREEHFTLDFAEARIIEKGIGFSKIEFGEVLYQVEVNIKYI